MVRRRDVGSGLKTVVYEVRLFPILPVPLVLLLPLPGLPSLSTLSLPRGLYCNQLPAPRLEVSDRFCSDGSWRSSDNLDFSISALHVGEQSE